MTDNNEIFKKHFFKIDHNGTVNIAFVGTEAELQAQMDKDFEELLDKAKSALKKYHEEFLKLSKPDFDNLEYKDIENLQKWVYYKIQILKSEKEIPQLKKPLIADNTFFTMHKIGKDIELIKKGD